MIYDFGHVLQNYVCQSCSYGLDSGEGFDVRMGA